MSSLATLEPILLSVCEVEESVKNGARSRSFTSSTRPPSEDDDKIINGAKTPSPVSSKVNGNNHSRKMALSDAVVAATTTVTPPKQQTPPRRPSREGYGLAISLTTEERDLFQLLRQAREDTHLTTTLRVAGGWVRDKLLATPEFQRLNQNRDRTKTHKRLTSKFQKPSSMGRQGTKVILESNSKKAPGDVVLEETVDEENQCRPVDIDIALDDMLGREFADHLNEYLQRQGQDTVSVGVVLKNPEKSKHLETATMKVGSFWIDFVNLRAEEYTQDSRIPDLMRIGTAAEDAFRRDLTINALFYNINTGQVEDWTGRGFDDLKHGVVSTPLAPLTTLLDDPLRVLRSIRFAARLRFTMDDDLVTAAKDRQVRTALAQKVSRERVGCEIDLMLRSPDPVGAMRLLINLNLATTVFPIENYLSSGSPSNSATLVLQKGLKLLGTTHDYLCDCRDSLPVWCEMKRSPTIHGLREVMLVNDEEARRLLWYASFLKPLLDYSKATSEEQASLQPPPSRRQGKKANRSIICSLLIDDLKRPICDAEMVRKIMTAADDITNLLKSGCDLAALSVLINDIRVTSEANQAPKDIDGAQQEESDDAIRGRLLCSMRGRPVDSMTDEDQLWQHAMEFRLLCSKVLQRVGSLWRAALILSLAEQLVSLDHELEYAIEGDVVRVCQQLFGHEADLVHLSNIFAFVPCYKLD
jgi:tRNA nucleotidyltransferase (CCA-adding enzyme)